VIFAVPLIYFILLPENIAVGLFLDSLYSNFTMVPADIVRGNNLYTLFTSMFLHLDIFHIGSNMLFLYVFGDNIEDAFGHVRYLLFYLICGVAAALAHTLSLTNARDLLIPTLGASGAISGVLGAYIVLYPKAKVLTLLLFRFAYLVPIPAAAFLGFWFILQLLFTSLNVGGGVAYWAHIGGFIAGVLFALVLRKMRKDGHSTQDRPDTVGRLSPVSSGATHNFCRQAPVQF
jgi:membrane associated rhomboid family serine protease